MSKTVSSHISFSKKGKRLAALTVMLLLTSAFIADFKFGSSSTETPPITAVTTFPGQMAGSYFASNGTLFAGDDNYNLYRSDDNGSSFRLTHTFPKQTSPVGNTAGYVRNVFVDSRSQIFVSIPCTNRLYRSTNFGGIFTEVLNTNGSQNDGFYIALTEDQNGSLYAATYDNSLYPQKPSILKSTDGGATWTKIFDAGTVHFHNVKFNPANGYLYAVTGEYGLGYDNTDCERVFRSKDSGQTWSLIVNRTKQDDVYGDTIYLTVLFNGSWVYFGSDQAYKPNWIDRIYDNGSDVAFVPQRVYNFSGDCNFPLASAVWLNGTMLFTSCPEMSDGVSRIVASSDGTNWQVIKAANASSLQHHTNMLTANPRGVTFGSDGPEQTFAIGNSPSMPSPRLFVDGFETGNFSAWTATGGDGNYSYDVETQNAHTGVYDANFSAAASSDSWVYKNITPSNITHLRQFVKLAALPSDGTRTYLGTIESVNSQNTVDAYVENVGGQYYWGLFTAINGVVYEDREAAASNLTAGTYYCIETCRDVTNGLNCLWVDGVLKVAAPHSNAGISTIIACGISWTDSAATVYVDDVEASTAYIGTTVNTTPTPTPTPSPTPTATPTPTPTPSPTPTPTLNPNETTYLTLQIHMSATVQAAPDYGETTLSKPIESCWMATNGTLYADSEGTVYKTADQGVTWQPQVAFSGADIDCVFVDHHGYVFVSPNSSASTGDLGLWRSTNGGQTWSRVLSLTSPCSVLTMDEDSNGTLYAGIYTVGDTVGNARIYRSLNGGASWISVYYNPSARHVHCVAVDKTNNYVYAALGDLYLSWTHCVVRSTDGGSSWQIILSGMPQVFSIQPIAGARLLGTDYPIDRNGRIFMTTDDSTYSGVLATGTDSYVFWMRTNPLNGRIYASFVSGEYNPNAAWIYSSDNGSVWVLYRTFNTSAPYCGSPYASNFVNGTMYYSIETSDMHNGTKIFPLTTINSSSIIDYSSTTLSVLPQSSFTAFRGGFAALVLGAPVLILSAFPIGKRRFHGYRFAGSNFIDASMAGR
jgi:photosystem II stability/assembly factor-like uncharacterized protein